MMMIFDQQMGHQVARSLYFLSIPSVVQYSITPLLAGMIDGFQH